MATIPKRAVTDNATGGIIKSGRSDFTGQFNPAIETQHDLSDSASWTTGVPMYHHKVVGTLVQEMTAPEKTAVDAYRDAMETAKLKFPVVVVKTVPNLSALPVPPPKMGVIVGVQNISGSPGIAISTGSNYIVFVSSGVHP